jgi:hypothetical protein
VDPAQSKELISFHFLSRSERFLAKYENARFSFSKQTCQNI